MNSIFQYLNLEKIEGKEVVLFGCLESREFALRLLEHGIYFHYFLFVEGNKYCLPHLLNKQIISTEELRMLNNYVIVSSYKDIGYAHEVLGKLGLEEKIVEIEKLKTELLEASDIVIYGTGKRAERIFKDIDGYLEVNWFCDSNKSKAGSFFCGKPIIHSSELSDCSMDCYIIIGSTFYDEIRNTLLQCGIKENHIFYMEYDLTVFSSSKQKYTYKLKHLLDLIRDCKSKRVLMYGEKNIVQKLSKVFNILDIEIESLIERNVFEEDGTIYSLAYFDMNNAICIVTDNYSVAVHDALDQMGIKETQYAWIENYNSFSISNPQREVLCLLDPHLGHAHTSDRERYPGFIQYEYVKDSEVKPVVILTLGGSTTSGYGVRQKSWSEYLSEILVENGINHIIYCGGIDSYTASQELVKLIRDGIWLKPDYVISYSGINNMSIESETPFVHYYQKEFYDSIINFASSSYWGTMHGVNYGVKTECDNYEYWFTQIKMMHAICDSLGIMYKAFLQPVLYSKLKYDETDVDIAFLNGFLLNKKKGEIEPLNKESMSSPIRLQRNALHFREAAKAVDEPWFCDLSSVFDDEKNVYMDYCHVYEKGNQIIAKKMYENIQDDLKKLVVK